MGKRNVLITGASRGIGLATVERFLQEEWNVIATMRRPELSDLQSGGALTVTRMDVTDSASIDAALAETMRSLGTLDVLVNNAGYGVLGPVEAIPMNAVREQMATNLVGMIEVTKAVLPVFRQQRAGRIVNISSAAGRLGLPGYGLYCASKFAMEGFSESLAFELATFGASVRIVEPGYVRTAFAESADVYTEAGATEYEGLARITNALRAAAEERAIDVNTVAEMILTAATDASSRLRYPVGPDAEAFLQARMSMSDEDFGALLVKSFGL